jgi:DNA-binding response OmpR family regulator
MTQILIVEDERSIAEMYRFKLEQAGHEVRLAENGVIGLELAQEISPDLILLDLRMPEMAGDEMLEKMRATDWGSGIPVIILTNIGKHEAPSSLRFLHVHRYIVKAHHTPAQVLQIANEVLEVKT